MNAADIAKYSGRSIDTVRYWERMGALPVSAKVGRRRVWKRTDIEAWFESKFAA
ncbi:helix-turn-helix transcriptional regulator [Mycolicibacterium hippocampi]|nr:helix-turn-helix domain-containing protein [Mycolicibacterium hippocampi]